LGSLADLANVGLRYLAQIPPGQLAPAEFALGEALETGSL
jgi:hypothetical protein